MRRRIFEYESINVKEFNDKNTQKGNFLIPIGVPASFEIGALELNFLMAGYVVLGSGWYSSFQSPPRGLSTEYSLIGDSHKKCSNHQKHIAPIVKYFGPLTNTMHSYFLNI